jgi:hypothetical protein
MNDCLVPLCNGALLLEFHGGTLAFRNQRPRQPFQVQAEVIQPAAKNPGDTVHASPGVSMMILGIKGVPSPSKAKARALTEKR